MSLALWLWRIYFDKGHGTIVRAGKRQMIESPPIIPELGPVEGIDYAPGITQDEPACYMILRKHEGWHEMEPDEARACFRWLKETCVVH